MYRENDYSTKTGFTKEQEFCEQLDRMKLSSLWTYMSGLDLLKRFLGICDAFPKTFFPWEWSTVTDIHVMSGFSAC